MPVGAIWHSQYRCFLDQLFRHLIKQNKRNLLCVQHNFLDRHDG